jgi:PPOX class probable F420-dependent enzyme
LRVSVDTETARATFAAARVARLATADAHGVPHLVPIVFAADGNIVYSAVDQKPKRTHALRRLANLAVNPSVSLLVDHYDDDWNALWWVRADGRALVLDTSAAETARAIDLLALRYHQYRAQRPDGPVIAITVQRWSGWQATST